MNLEAFLGTPLQTAGFSWVLAALVTSGLAVSSPRSVLRNASLPRLVRIGLFCTELLLLAGVFYGAELLIILFRSGYSEGPLSWGTSIMSLLIYTVYFMSWGSFIAVGTFTNVAALLSLFANAKQYVAQLKHNTLDVLAGAFFGIALLIALAVFGIPFVINNIPKENLPVCVFLIMALLAGCAVFSFLGFVQAGRLSLSGRLPDLLDYASDYLHGRDNATGPLMHAFIDAWHWIYRSYPKKQPHPQKMAERNIVSMEQYTADITPSETKQWNVLLIIVESLREDRLTVTGGEREIMPALEQLARQSHVYANHYTQATHSDYSDMCPLSSHYPLRSFLPHTYPRNPAYPRIMVYDILKRHDYRTAVISSQDETWGGMINYMDTGNLDHIFHSKNADQFFPAGKDIPRHSGKLDDSITVDEASRWISGDSSSPFFLYMNLQNSHVPYEVPEGFPRPFSQGKPNFPLGINRIPKDRLNEVKDLYSDSLAYVDAQLGKLFDTLKQNGMWDNTLIAITGDTGQAFYEHGFSGHGNVPFEELLRVPFIFRVPGEAPALHKDLSQHIDIPPTILGRLGLPPHPSFQGVDLRTAPAEKRTAYAVCQTPLSHSYALVQGRFKIIHDLRKQRTFLFDLENDPSESTDISAQFPAVFKDLSAQLSFWSRSQLDYYASPERWQREYPPTFHA